MAAANTEGEKKLHGRACVGTCEDTKFEGVRDREGSTWQGKHRGCSSVVLGSHTGFGLWGKLRLSCQVAWISLHGRHEQIATRQPGQAQQQEHSSLGKRCNSRQMLNSWRTCTHGFAAEQCNLAITACCLPLASP